MADTSLNIKWSHVVSSPCPFLVASTKHAHLYTSVFFLPSFSACQWLHLTGSLVHEFLRPLSRLKRSVTNWPMTRHDTTEEQRLKQSETCNRTTRDQNLSRCRQVPFNVNTRNLHPRSSRSWGLKFVWYRQISAMYRFPLKQVSLYTAAKA